MPRSLVRKDSTRLSRDARQAIAVWIEENPGVLTQIAQAVQKSRPFVSLILRGRRSSADGLIERLLRKAGAPITFVAASLLLFIPLLSAQPRLSITPVVANAAPGQTISFSLAYQGAANTGIQWTIPTPPTLLFNGILPGPALGDGSGTTKGLYTTQTTVSGVVQSSSVVAGLNSTILPNVELAKFQIKIPLGTRPGPFNLAVSNIQAVKSVPASTTTGCNLWPTLTVCPVLDTTINSAATYTINVTGLRGDLNGDGLINITDLGLLAAQGTGGASCTTGDLDANGKCDIVDAALLVAASLAAALGGN